MKRSFALAAFSALSGLASTQAAVISLTPAADRTIRGEGTSSADDGTLIIGYNNNSYALHALLSFTLAPITLGPGESIVVTGVTMDVRLATTPGLGNGALTVTLNDYGFSFTESGAIWADPDGNGNSATGDTTPGGTAGTPLSTITVSNPGSTSDVARTFGSSSAFVADVQSIIGTGGELNYIMTSNATSDSFFTRLVSSEGATAGYRPTLVISYEVIPEPSAAMLAGLAGLGFMARRRR
ncbi:PEP-CTERM sorting domain-containing protein [Luteolibacter sp. SL250]|uniref:PEP-CTERM sorting domain-containing protein n=1 Tax=Luteolibacter sp. SL250 TaxID=2995170 RepID=UPI0022715FE5|nr:PEP-CTERM sorting domain-containing protein [Luteolibacter sp. SL250]WAC21544.1 PEP-CTERM sorting domain-containing protein [Luteolibacter sp. SL250]